MTTRRPWPADPLLLALLALSLGANVWLGLELRGARRAAAAPGSAGPEVGDTLPPLAAEGLDGRPATLAAADDSRPTVLYLYSHTCGWCRRNQPAVAALAEQAGERFRFLGVCLGPKDGCARRDGDPPFPLYAGLRPDQVADLGLGAVPLTLVVDPAGRVARRFRGAWVQGTRREIEQYFQAALPDLEPTPLAAALQPVDEPGRTVPWPKAPTAPLRSGGSPSDEMR